MPTIKENKQILADAGLWPTFDITDIDSPEYQTVLSQYLKEQNKPPSLFGKVSGFISKRQETVREQNSNNPILNYIKNIGPETILGYKPYKSLPKQDSGNTQYNIATQQEDITLPGVGQELSVDDVIKVMQEGTTQDVSQPTIPLIQHPDTPQGQTSLQNNAQRGIVNIDEMLTGLSLEQSGKGKFRNFLSNPAFINFLAQMGSAIGGKGSVGEALGQATIGLQKSKIYSQALERITEGKDLEGLPVQFLDPEQRLSLEKYGIQKAKTEADTAYTEKKTEQSTLSDLEKLKFTRETQLQYAGIINKARSTNDFIQVKKLATSWNDRVYDKSQDELKRTKGAIVDKGFVEEDFKKIYQKNFLEAYEGYGGTASLFAPEVFQPFIEGTTSEGDYFLRPEGIYQYKDNKGYIVRKF